MKYTKEVPMTSEETIAHLESELEKLKEHCGFLQDRDGDSQDIIARLKTESRQNMPIMNSPKVGEALDNFKIENSHKLASNLYPKMTSVGVPFIIGSGNVDEIGGDIRRDDTALYAQREDGVDCLFFGTSEEDVLNILKEV